MASSARVFVGVVVGVAVGAAGALLAHRWYLTKDVAKLQPAVEAGGAGWVDCGTRDGWRWRDCKFARETVVPASLPPGAPPAAGYIEWSGDPSSRRVVPR